MRRLIDDLNLPLNKNVPMMNNELTIERSEAHREPHIIALFCPSVNGMISVGLLWMGFGKFANTC
jgi:hypothetical protein